VNCFRRKEKNAMAAFAVLTDGFAWSPPLPAMRASLYIAFGAQRTSALAGIGIDVATSPS